MSFFRRLTDERGVALPVALAVLFTVAGLATVAARRDRLQQPVIPRQQRQARRAGRERRLQAAVYQTNLLQPSSTQCVHKATSNGALTNGALQADTWCQPQTEDLGDGATYTFQALPTTVTTSTGCPWTSGRSSVTGP